MLGLYNRIRDLILQKFPDHEEKMGLSPEKYPNLYECRFAINSAQPFAFHLCNDGPDRIMLLILPAVWTENHDPYLIHRIFDSKGISFTSDRAESLSITGPETKKLLDVFHLTHGDDSVDEYVSMTEKKLLAKILAHPLLSPAAAQ